MAETLGKPVAALPKERTISRAIGAPQESRSGKRRMKEIDETDLPGFLRLRAWAARRKSEKKKPRQRFIDEVWPRVKP